MNFIYLSQEFTIYPHRQVIEKRSNLTQVRPKTFALLLLLLEKPREVLSKTYLLNTIWDDVTVEEQVLVQSIRELRQLFGDTEIIQTYPRKGYAWAADVKKQMADTEPQVIDTPKESFKSEELRSNKISKRGIYTAAIIAVVLLVAFAAIFNTLLGKHNSTPSQTEVVIVLPMKNHIAGNDHNWVPLGGMDQLIHLLVPNKNVQVMTTEYVLHLMEYAQLPRDYDSQKVARIFEISGATLIVESQLSGTVEGYQLDYKLRYKNDIKRGVIFDRDLTLAVNKLAQVIVSQTGQKLQNADTNAQTTFTNELMARAQEKLEQQEYDAAQSLLVSLKQLEPHNLIAREKLVEMFVHTNKFDQAKSEIDEALALAKTESNANSAKIYLFWAIMQWQQGKLAEALKTLDSAEQFAATNNDILYQASVAEMRGVIQQQNGAYDLAQASYEQSLKFDTVIRCPIGISASHIKLAKLFALQGKSELVKKHYNDAKKLIEANQFTDMLFELESAKPVEIQ